MGLMDYFEMQESATSGDMVLTKWQPTEDERDLARSVCEAVDGPAFRPEDLVAHEQWWDNDWSAEAMSERERAYDPMAERRKLVHLPEWNDEQRRQHEATAERECVLSLLKEGIPLEESQEDRLRRAQRVLIVHRLLSDHEMIQRGEPFGGLQSASGKRRWGSRAWGYATIQGRTRARWHELVRLALRECRLVADLRRPEEPKGDAVPSEAEVADSSPNARRKWTTDEAAGFLLDLFKLNAEAADWSQRRLGQYLDIPKTTVGRALKLPILAALVDNHRRENRDRLRRS